MSPLIIYFIQLQVVNAEYSAYLDPIIALVYIVVLVWSCVPLVRDSCLILLQTIPGEVVIKHQTHFKIISAKNPN